MPRRVDNVVFGWLSGDQYQERRRGPQRDQFLPVVRGTITMTVGSWTEEDVKNGLREPSGALVGGLVVLVEQMQTRAGTSPSDRQKG